MGERSSEDGVRVSLPAPGPAPAPSSWPSIPRRRRSPAPTPPSLSSISGGSPLEQTRRASGAGRQRMDGHRPRATWTISLAGPTCKGY